MYMEPFDGIIKSRKESYYIILHFLIINEPRR